MVVLDTSALLASLLDEPGRQAVDAAINGAVMTTVNLAEVVGHFARLGNSAATIAELLDGLPIRYVAPDEAVAVEAGMLRAVGEPFGLSLGDRMCLAYAKRIGATAMTADRAWRDASDAIGVDVQLIR